jgi:hypothetical protein
VTENKVYSKGLPWTLNVFSCLCITLNLISFSPNSQSPELKVYSNNFWISCCKRYLSESFICLTSFCFRMIFLKVIISVGVKLKSVVQGCNCGQLNKTMNLFVDFCCSNWYYPSCFDWNQLILIGVFFYLQISSKYFTAAFASWDNKLRLVVSILFSQQMVPHIHHQILQPAFIICQYSNTFLARQVWIPFLFTGSDHEQLQLRKCFFVF